MRYLLLVMIVCSIVGCGADRKSTTVATRNKTAAVEEAVLNSTVTYVTANPTAVVGARPEDIPLYNIVGVEPVSNSNFVVANAGSRELLLFDGRGRNLGKAGGRGAGPGEFVMIGGLKRFRADSVLVLDSYLLRLLVFSPRLQYTREIQPQRPDRGQPALLGALEDGTLILSFADPVGSASGIGDHAVVGAFSRYDADGRYLNPIGKYAVGEVSVTPSNVGVLLAIKPFEKETAVAVSADRLYIAPADRAEVLEVSPTGAILRTIRLDIRINQVNAADKDAFARQLKAKHKDLPPNLIRDLSFPEIFPPHGAIVADPCGGFWIEEYQRPTDQNEQWLAVTAKGTSAAPVKLPEGYSLLRLTPEELMGVHKDSDGVESVRVYPRPASLVTRSGCRIQRVRVNS